MSWRYLMTRSPRTAAAWFARLQSREVSAAERTQFQLWLEAEPGNQEAFRRSEKLWQLLGVVVRDGQAIEFTRRTLSQSELTRSDRASIGRWSAVTAALVLAAVASSWAVEHVGVRGVETAVGEQQRIVLVDGSCVTLNTASRLRIDYRFGRRRILLEKGEALFDVAHDPSHPFVVQAGQSIVTALGTEFAVAKSVQGVEVSVLEGRVRAGSVRAREAIHPSVVLTAGQAGRLVPGNREWIRGDADSGRIKAWQAARLQFQNETLEAVVTEFNRYSTTQLVLEDAQLAALPVSGVFRIGQTESLVRALVEVYPIKARRESTRILLRLAPSSATPMEYIVKGSETQAAPSDRPQGQMPRISE